MMIMICLPSDLDSVTRMPSRSVPRPWHLSLLSMSLAGPAAPPRPPIAARGPTQRLPGPGQVMILTPTADDSASVICQVASAPAATSCAVAVWAGAYGLQALRSRDQETVFGGHSMFARHLLALFAATILLLDRADSFSFTSSYSYSSRCAKLTSSLSNHKSIARATPSLTRTSPKMSDMSDMTIEMLKRLERTLDQLPEMDLVRVR
jgi:hypothetical protein